MKIEKIKYKGIQIEIYDKEDGSFLVEALGLSANEYFSPRRVRGFYTLGEALEFIKAEIDELLSESLTTWGELANAITLASREGYEDFHLSEEVLKTLVINFLKTNPEIKDKGSTYYLGWVKTSLDC